jgi:hypothetical protein
VENAGLSGIESPTTPATEAICRLNAQKSASPDTVANTLVRHAATGDGDWDYRDASEFLHLWADIFNREFFGGRLPQPVISFENCRIEVLGYFIPGRYLISRGSWQLSGSSLIPRCAKEVDQRFQH